MSAVSEPRCAVLPAFLLHVLSSGRLVILIILTLGLEPGRALAQRVLGTDVSGYQTNINWTTVKNAGVVFAWAKATEKTNYTNPYFVSQETNAVKVGIYIGAYHFARPSADPAITGARSADTEAAYFWGVASNYVKLGGAYLVPMLDWEDPDCTNQLSVTTMSQWVNEWCNAVSNYARAQGVYGMKPVVYTGAWYSKPSSTYSGLDSSVTIWPAWISYYPSGNSTAGYGTPYPLTDSMPSSAYCYPWSACNIWQYGDTNWSGGDADVSNGNLSQFVQMFVVGGTNAPSITAAPTNVTIALGGSTTFSVRASGQNPLTYSWLFNGAVIPNATTSNCPIAGVQLTNAGGYTAVVSNSYGRISSSTVFLSVLSPLTNTAGCVLAPPGMVDWWPAGGNANDIYGSYNGVPANGTSYATGEQGMAFHFDGVSSYMTVPGAADVPVPWTACMWVNRQNAPGTAAALMGDGTYELKLEQYNGTRQVGVTQMGVGDYSFGCIVPAGRWTHLAFVGTSTGTSLYVNGVLQATLSNTLPLPRTYIGANYVSSSSKFVDYMLGSLDEILVFNRALNNTEIQSIYAAGSAGLVRVPQLTGSGLWSNNQFQLNLRGQTGKTFSIYRSTDLQVWTRLATDIANSTGSASWTDTAATNALSFYRISQP
jgi:GH25 family lysozyme M1 (1,4-beta-N-acetylmuramidase)